MKIFGKNKNSEPYLSQQDVFVYKKTNLVDADNIHAQMVDVGLKNFQLARIDFTFQSNAKEKVQALADYLKTNYRFTKFELSKDRKQGLHLLNCEAPLLPITKENFTVVVMDMLQKGFVHDCLLTGYGAYIDEPKFPDFSQEMYTEYLEEGITQFDADQISYAAISFTNAIQCAPDNKNPQAWYSRGVCKHTLGLIDTAMDDYNTALKKVPNDPTILLNRGALKDESLDYEGAIADYDIVIEKEPDKVNAYYNRGNSKYHLADFEGAKADWEKAKELGSEDAVEALKMVDFD